MLVFQSHSVKTPSWILRCTASVRAWADRNGYAYRLLGNELFEGIPAAISLKAQSMLPLADMGRLLWAERLLKEWDCVIWIDADVLVFDPSNFAVDTTLPHLVCREVLVRREKGAALPTVLLGSNPTVLMFQRGSSLPARWLGQMRKVAARRPGLGDADFGRELLRQIAPRGGLPAIRTVGHFNAAILKEIYGHEGPSIELMMKASGVPFAAANLCGHHKLPNDAYFRIIDRLIESGGAVVNDWLPRKATSPPV